MITADHLTKQFGTTRAVDDVSFRVEEGENFVFLGTSGCGKTTTLRMINRLIEPTSGTVTINGRNVLDQQPEILRRSIGYVLQHNGLFPHYTVAQNIAVVPRLLRMPEDRIRERTTELLEKLHLSPGKYNNLYPAQLSGGQQQRVGLARALAADPPVLLMDEPFGALDTITRTAIRRELTGLDEFRRKTILLVTHDVQEAFSLADKICLMDKGRIVQTGSPADLLFRPANSFVTDFLREDTLQLSLRALKLDQVWDELEASSKRDAADTGVEVVRTMNFWEALQESYTATTHEQPKLPNVAEAPLRVSFSTLMNAYNNFEKDHRLNAGPLPGKAT